MQRLIAVLRTPQAMLALVSERRSSDAPASSSDPYMERTVPLAALSEAVCPWKEKDLRAWRALSRVPAMTERAGLAIVRSIIGSAVAPEYQVREPPALVFAGDGLDLRPHLCCPETEQLLLDQLAELLDEVSASVDFPDWHWKRRRELAALPAEFRRSFLWGLHLSPWGRVKETLSLYGDLQLEEQPPLRRAVARLLSLADREAGLAFCRTLLDVSPAEQVDATERLLETGAYARPPSAR